MKFTNIEEQVCRARDPIGNDCNSFRASFTELNLLTLLGNVVLYLYCLVHISAGTGSHKHSNRPYSATELLKPNVNSNCRTINLPGIIFLFSVSSYVTMASQCGWLITGAYI